MKNYLVCGWRESIDYDMGRAATQCVPIKAKDESEAETKGRKKLSERGVKCEVIEANEVE